MHFKEQGNSLISTWRMANIKPSFWFFWHFFLLEIFNENEFRLYFLSENYNANNTLLFIFQTDYKNLFTWDETEFMLKLSKEASSKNKEYATGLLLKNVFITLLSQHSSTNRKEDNGQCWNHTNFNIIL